MHSNIKNFQLKVSYCVLDKITYKIPQYTIFKDKLLLPNNILLADSNFHVPGPIDLLLGADVYYSIVHEIPRCIPRSDLYLVETHFGHVVTSYLLIPFLLKTCCCTTKLRP